MKRLTLNAAALCVAFVVLAILRWTTPGYAVLTGPIPVAGKLGRTIAGRGITVEIGDVQFVKSLHYRAYGKTVERASGGVFAVLRASLAATAASTVVNGIEWRAPDGVTFAHSRRVEGAASLLLGKRLQPGLPQEGVFVFELPQEQLRPEQLKGATVLISEVAEPRLDSQAQIRLPPHLEGLISVDGLDLDDLARAR
ncbi:hypothetical protein SAMN05519104_2778 [Rhizobiales bacterium GAS188]|nr:hypothetical protein SAMN05519104_2778 [Rhizobiales bacterium GAS188]